MYYFRMSLICHWDDFKPLDCRLHVATEYYSSGEVLPSGTWGCGSNKREYDNTPAVQGQLRSERIEIGSHRVLLRFMRNTAFSVGTRATTGAMINQVEFLRSCISM
jgi:hypothetical protein